VARLLAECAHDPNPRQGFLQVRGDLRDLLARQPVRARRRQPERHAAHGEHRERQEGDERKLRVEDEQDGRGPEQSERGREQRDDAIRHELVEGLDVVREPRDQDAGLVARVEPDGEPLQVGEDPLAQVLKRALADPVDEIRLRVRRDPVDQGRADERDHDHGQEVGVFLPDPVVDRATGQVGRDQRGGGRGHHRDEQEHDLAPVGLQQLQQAAKLARPLVLAPEQHPDRADSCPHSPATSRSTEFSVRNTASGRPFSAISR
jgi:hypothetical protein